MSDSEKSSDVIESTAGDFLINVEGIVGQQNEGCTYEMSLPIITLLPFSFNLILVCTGVNNSSRI